jgi:hypothetical protein
VVPQVDVARLVTQHLEDQAVQCPRCKAEEGQPCINTFTGKPMHEVHWQRLKVTA